MDRSSWPCADCVAMNPWTAAFCEVCGLGRPGRVSPVAAPSMPAVYREPVARPAYVEPTEAEAREIRIKLGETIDKLTVAMGPEPAKVTHLPGTMTREGLTVPLHTEPVCAGCGQLATRHVLRDARLWHNGCWTAYVARRKAERGVRRAAR